jgi:hypothetical protein
MIGETKINFGDVVELRDPESNTDETSDDPSFRNNAASIGNTVLRTLGLKG